MSSSEKENTTALPIDDRPEVHKAGNGSGLSAPISLEEDKQIRDGELPADRFDDDRFTDLKKQERQVEREQKARDTSRS